MVEAGQVRFGEPSAMSGVGRAPTEPGRSERAAERRLDRCPVSGRRRDGSLWRDRARQCRQGRAVCGHGAAIAAMAALGQSGHSRFRRPFRVNGFFGSRSSSDRNAISGAATAAERGAAGDPHRAFYRPKQKKTLVAGDLWPGLALSVRSEQGVALLQRPVPFFNRSATRRAIAAGAWSGMAKTELTLISQST